MDVLKVYLSVEMTVDLKAYLSVEMMDNIRV
jgi:hypothetical protein